MILLLLLDRKQPLPVPRVSIYRSARNGARFTTPKGEGEKESVNQTCLTTLRTVNLTSIGELFARRIVFDPSFSVSLENSLLFSNIIPPFTILQKYRIYPQIPFQDLNSLKIKVNRNRRGAEKSKFGF